MLRKLCRSLEADKQAKMADCGSLTSPTQYQKESISSFIVSPRLFSGSDRKGAEFEVSVSPTSILDAKPFNPLGNPSGCNPNVPKSPKTFSVNKPPWDKLDHEGIGLALITSHNDENCSKPTTRKVLFGQRLEVQIPSLPHTTLSPTESPKSPDFGIKTRNALSTKQTKNSPQVFTGCLSVTEMELSEDYTCVISHGPNPKTTHIFDNCIVGSCQGVVGSPALRRECCLGKQNLSYASESFLHFCYSCKKNLGHEKDIYIYRGEKAFCSQDCRSQEILLDEVGNSE